MSFVELEIDGEILTFEATEGPTRRGLQPTGVGDTVRKRMDDVLEPLRLYAKGIAAKVVAMEPKPDEVEVKIGISVSADAGIVFAKAGTEGQMEITLKWKTGA